MRAERLRFRLGLVPVNPRKQAFKELILADVKVGKSSGRSAAELAESAKLARPDLFDDEPCYPGCDSHHFKWQHEFQRCLWDLRSGRRPKIVLFDHQFSRP